MIFPSLVVSVLLLAPSPHHMYGLTEAMPRIDGTIRVATYNVLNFFDHKNDPTLEGDYDDFGDNPGPTSLERCRELAKVIREINADVLALQEVESYVALEWFRDEFLSDMGYQYIASEDVGYYRGIEQSVLSRFPITKVKIWPNTDLLKVHREGIDWTPAPPDAHELVFQRSPLCVTIETTSGYELTLLTVHHKAGRNNNWHRESEALKIMEFIGEMMLNDPTANIIVLGDFNATPWDRSFKTYLRGGMVDSMAHRSINIQYNPDAPLWKTHTSDRVIDFILLNAAALGEFVVNSGFILGTSAQEYDWRNKPIPPGYASDHYPVAIDLVPIDGQGATKRALPWPEAATRSALLHATVDQAPSDITTLKTISAVGALFVGSKRSKKFHDASCHNTNRIKESNLVGYASVKDAIDSGKEPAACCHPSVK